MTIQLSVVVIVLIQTFYANNCQNFNFIINFLSEMILKSLIYIDFVFFFKKDWILDL